MNLVICAELTSILDRRKSGQARRAAEDGAAKNQSARTDQQTRRTHSAVPCKDCRQTDFRARQLLQEAAQIW